MKLLTTTALTTTLLSLLFSTIFVVNAQHYTEGARRNTLILTRTADDGAITSLLDPLNITEGERTQEACEFDGGLLTIGHPMDLHPSDKWFSICNLFQKGYELMIDSINSFPRCGLRVQGKNYGLILKSYESDGSKWKAAAIAKSIESTTDFFLAPYTSSISNEISAVAHDAKKIMIAPGSYFTYVYENRPGSFGVLPLPEQYLKQVIPMLAEAGARTVQTVYEGGPGKQCESARILTDEYNMIIQAEHQMDADPKMIDFLPIAYNMSQADQNPDVVITCTYDAACSEWISALRNISWSPKAQVFSICIGMETFAEQVGTDAEYMIGSSPWDRSLKTTDAINGWSSEYFAELFESYSGRDAAYHAAIGQATVSVLAQAIELSNSLSYENVSEALSTGEFNTVFGKVIFDKNGQNEMNLIATQYNNNMSVNVIYPPELADASIVYPMPTWNERDCNKLSPCNEVGGAYNGICSKDGTCLCGDDETQYSYGTGITAACHYIPNEDMTYMSTGIKIVGYILCTIQCIVSIFFIGWTFYYRSHKVVSLSQPLFLVLVAFGCLVMSLSIIPLAVEGDYRVEQDPDTGLLSSDDIRADGVKGLDIACMAFPWLIAMGFGITFSALFAKIVRIKKIMNNARRFSRTKVEVKDVISIMVSIILVEAIVLFTWQFIAPLRWDRVVVVTSDLGYPVQSVGMCSSENQPASMIFVIVLFVLNLGCILTAVVFCFITRDIKSTLNEGMWIAAAIVSILQILVVAVPIAIIASENTSASFFVTSAAVFIMSMAVTIFIFVPKFYNLHFNENVNEMIASDLRRSSRGRRMVSSMEGSRRAASMKNSAGNSVRSTDSSGTKRKYGLYLSEADMNRSVVSSEFTPNVVEEDDVEKPVLEKDDDDDDDNVKPEEEQDYTKGLNDEKKETN